MSDGCRSVARGFPGREATRSKCSMPIRDASSGFASPRARSVLLHGPSARDDAARPRRRQVSYRQTTMPIRRLVTEPAPSEPTPYTSLARSWDHPGVGLEARRYSVWRRLAVGARDGPVQCMAGAVRHVSGDGLVDRWLGCGTAARYSCCGAGRLVVRIRLFCAGTVLDRLRVPGGCTDFRLAYAVRGAGSAGLPGAISRSRFWTGATDLDRRRFKGARARC